MFVTKVALSTMRSFRLGVAKSFVFELVSSESLSLTSAVPSKCTSKATQVSVVSEGAGKGASVLPPGSFSSAEKLGEALEKAVALEDDGVANIWVPAESLMVPSEFNIYNNKVQMNLLPDNSTSSNNDTRQLQNQDNVEELTESVPLSLLQEWDEKGFQHARARDLSPRADDGVHLPASLVQKMSPHCQAGNHAEKQEILENVSEFSLASRGLIDAATNADVVALKDALLIAHPDDECAKHGASPLHLVSATHVDEDAAIECLKLLLKQGANINKRASNGSTPLHWAAGNGNGAIVDFLLDQGADPALMTFTWFRDVFGRHSGQTCLHWAAESGHKHIVELVLEKYPWIVGSVDERGSTPSALALKEANFDTHDLLSSKEEEVYVLLRAKLEGVVASPL